MRIKMTAVLLSALLPLSVWAAPEQSGSKQSAVKHEQKAEWRHEKMQERQSAWFDRLELTPTQREAFQAEMKEHWDQQKTAREAHHDKLRGLLDDKQRAAFDEDTKKMHDKMKNRMHKHDTSKRSGEYKYGKRANTTE